MAKPETDLRARLRIMCKSGKVPTFGKNIMKLTSLH